MNTEVKNTIKATDRDAQYDESAKRLLGQKNNTGTYTCKNSR